MCPAATAGALPARQFRITPKSNVDQHLRGELARLGEANLRPEADGAAWIAADDIDALACGRQPVAERGDDGVEQILVAVRGNEAVEQGFGELKGGWADMN